MHAREAHEEQQHAPRRADGGTITPATGLDRRRPLASPPARSTATAVAAALVERREDEAMSSYVDFHRAKSRRERDQALKTPSRMPSSLRSLEGDEIVS